MTMAFPNPSPNQASPVPGQSIGGASPATAFGGNQDPAQQYSAMSQQEWLDYVNTFMPIENQAIAYSGNQTLPQQRMLDAIQGVRAQEGQTYGTRARELANMGVTMHADEATAARRMDSVNNALSEVDAANRAGSQALDSQRAILGSPVPTGAPMRPSSSITQVG